MSLLMSDPSLERRNLRGRPVVIRAGDFRSKAVTVVKKTKNKNVMMVAELQFADKGDR